MKKLYAFSGLGTDKRVFDKLDLSGFEVVHIEWLQPELKESFANYVSRLAVYYAIPKKGAYAIGVSFGGMCLCELAKLFEFEKILLISTAKTKYELPAYYRLLKIVPVHQLISAKYLGKYSNFLNRFFSGDTTVDTELLKRIIEDTDINFLKWAIDCILRWDNKHVPQDFFHIHGDHDRILPISNIKYLMRIRGGGHLMTLDKADAMSIHIRKYLNA